MAQTLVSLYPHIKDSKNGVDLPFEIFLLNIQTGKWQDLIIPLRPKLAATTTKEERSELKQSLPYVTISGTFTTRSNAGLKLHSGLLAVDIDNVDPNDVKRMLRYDRHVYAIFASCSNTGACVVFKIHPLKHLASFEGIAEYLFKNYKIVIDQACKDISRPRYISYDPDIFIENNAQEFKEYSKQKPGPKKGHKECEIVYIKSEFDQIIAEIEEKGADLCPSYQDWLKAAYALADKFGESGRDYFHIISRQGSTYTEPSCDKQYDAVLNNLKEGGKPITIASIYFLAKTAGINTASETVKNISRRAATHKGAHSSIEQSIANIIAFPEVEASPELIRDIVTQVYERDIKIDDVSEIESGRIWMRNYGLRRNVLTGQLHHSGPALTNAEIDSIELKMREDMPDIEKSSITLLLKSSAVPEFHEIRDFFNKYKELKPTGKIKALADCLNSPTGAGTDYVERMLTKWIVGAIASVYGEESHIMLILCGERHGDGKSYFFKNFLPPELRHLTAEKSFSTLSNEAMKRDFEIAITKYWLIFDDEMGNKSKRDHAAIKAMLAKSFSDVRAAYARTEEHRKRISFFGGTSNELGVVADHGENRRAVPVQILPNGIDQVSKDKIDPIDYLMEGFHLYQSGYDFRILKEEIDFLNAHTEVFKEFTLENELVSKRFRKAEKGCGEYLTGTDIKIILEMGIKDRINVNRIKSAMRDIGCTQEGRTVNGLYGRYYYVCQNGYDIFIPPPKQDLPF